MSQELTLKVAQEFLQDNDAVDLSEFTSIADDAAAALSIQECYLSLGGLTRLSDAAAAALAKHKDSLSLDGLTSLSDAAAAALAKHKDSLSLNGLTSLSDAAAAALAKCKGRIELGGLTSLSDEGAVALAQRECMPWLNGLTELSDAAALALSKHKGTLYLDGLTSLSDGAAAAFARHEGDLSLRGLTTLSDATVTTLSQQKGRLGLDGLKSLSGAAAVALANHEGDLSFEGLEILTDEAAAALSKHEGGLRLISLTSTWSQTEGWELSEAAAASLAMHKGEVELNCQAKAAYRAAKLKGVPKLKWDPDFLKGVKARWKKSLGIDGFTSAEQLLATLTSQGTSPEDIIACLEANDMCSGGDSACERAVKVGWLTGAWDVSWTTFQEAMESQSPDEMAQQAAELIAEACAGDSAETGDESEDDNDSEDEVSDEDEPKSETDALEQYNRFKEMDLLLRETAAVLCAADGRFTSAEQQWIEDFWGLGAPSQILLLAGALTEEALHEKLKTFGAARSQTDRDLFLELLNPIEELLAVSATADEETARLEGVREIIRSASSDEQAESEEEDDSDSEADDNPLEVALRSGEIEEALALRRAGKRIKDPEQFSSFLAGLCEENLQGLNSAQVNPDQLPRIVSLQEVITNCGPIYDVGSTVSIGPRPAGWGSAAAEDRILSWRDAGYGLVGDQTVDIDTRYITARPLTAYRDAIVAGPLDASGFEPLPDELAVVKWEGAPVSFSPFDSAAFRRLYVRAIQSKKELEWNQAFAAKALAREAWMFYVQSDQAESHAEILLALGTLQRDPEEATAKLAKAAELDPALGRWAKTVAAARGCLAATTPAEWKEALAQLKTCPAESQLEQALVTACETLMAVQGGAPVALDALEGWVANFRDLRSPYVSWMLERACDAILEAWFQAEENLGEKPQLLQQAVRCGFRDACGPLAVAACHVGNESLLEHLLTLGFSAQGRYINGLCLVPLATAVYKDNLVAVRLLLKHGADPLQPSHYGGATPAECAWQQVNISESGGAAKEILAIFEARLGKDHPAFTLSDPKSDS